MKLLVISSAPNLSGGPRVLLDLCGRLRGEGLEFYFLFMSDGPRRSDFETLGKAECWSVDPVGLKGKLLAGCLLQPGYRRRMRDLLERVSPDALYLNTASTCWALPSLADCGLPIFMHVHELWSMTEKFCGSFRKAFTSVPTRYIAASRAVSNHLVKDWGIDQSAVDVCYEATNPARIEAGLNAGCAYSLDRGNALVVGGAGKVNRRKGIDLWLEMAAEIRKLMPDRELKFVWCGPEPTPATGRIYGVVKQKIDSLNLADCVEFTGYLDNPYPVMQEMDVFAMTSREDPCPVVNLETMYLQKPVVYFKASGGSIEVVRDDAGIGCATMAPRPIAEAVADLLKDPSRRAEMGRIGNERVIARFTIETLAQQIQSIVQQPNSSINP